VTAAEFGSFEFNHYRLICAGPRRFGSGISLFAVITAVHQSARRPISEDGETRTL
jgi:hypothetical protein